MTTEPSPDFSSIRFPTDRLTLGQLLRLNSAIQPSGEPPFNVLLADLKGGEEAWTERQLATAAFRKEMGVPWNQGMCEGDWSDAAKSLNDLYTAMGWSSGSHQTEEMVRRFTEAARDQALALKGKSK